MSTFAGGERWRNHPGLKIRIKHLFPGFTWAVAALAVVTAVEMFVPGSGHAEPHGTKAAGAHHHAHGDAAKTAGGGGGH